MKNTLPPVPLRRKKRKSIRMSQNHTLVHESKDMNKVHVINNDCVPITFNKSEVPPASHLSLEMKMKLRLRSLNHDEMYEQIDIIEDMVRVKNDDVTSHEILPDYSACSVVDEKTEITDDLAIDDCDTSNKYLESTLKIMDNLQIIKPVVINNQTRLDRNFICAISNSCSSASDRNFNDMDENNYNNSDDNHDAKNKNEPMIDTSNKKNNNNDNNMFEVNFYASPDQACSDDVESTDKGKRSVRKYMKRYESYKDKMLLMYSMKMYRVPIVASGKGNVHASNIKINADEPHESREYYIDCTSREDGCTASFQCLTTQRKSETHTAKPGIPCLKTSTQSIQRNNKQKFVKFDNDSTVNSTATKKLKRKAPSIPNTRTFLVPANNQTGSQQTMGAINNTNSNQIVQSETLDHNNSAKPGEEALVSTVVGGPSIPHSHHIKNNTITEERRRVHKAKLTPIIVKSKINARDITKYFNYPNKENRCEYDVNTLRNTGNETMGSNFSRHHGKGLTGRRTQSSGNLCDPQGKLNDVSKMFVPCSSTSEQRYNITGSLPNNLDNDKQTNNMDNLSDNNNIVSDTSDGNSGDVLTHAKSYRQVKFYDRSTIGMELVKYHSHDSLKGDPWKYQQNSDMDPVRCQHEMSAIEQGSKTLPIRRIDPKWCDPRSIRAIHQKHPIDIVGGHQSDCQLVIHRQRERFSNANSKPLIVGEHHNQDQGYASERSPEDEHPSLLSRQSILDVNSESTFRIILQKSSRGLGLSVSGGGTTGPVRVKRLFPQQPAALSNQLKPGDILLAANGIPLSGLTNYEALEVLRTTSSIVELLVCRPAGETSITPPGDPPTPPARRKQPSPILRLLNPIPPLHIEPCGEFDIEMTKVDGSLGFTLRKVDSSALGHYVRALVREPALSDGRIQPGDKIVAVDDALLSPLSHEEAVSLLRQCGPKVKLRLYRDLAQTPVSALSPTEPDHPLRPSHTSLRQEAVDMLCDLAVRKLSPTTSNGSGCQYYSGAPTTSPRRLRKPVVRTSPTENDNKELANDSIQLCAEAKSQNSNTDKSFIQTNGSRSQIEISSPPHDSCDGAKPCRPKFLQLPSSTDKIEFRTDSAFKSKDKEHGELIVNTITATTAPTTLTTPITINSDSHVHDYEYQYHSINLSMDNMNDNNLSFEPASMPPLISSLNTNGDAGLSYKNPVYQSAKQTCTRQEGEEHLDCARGQGPSYFSDHDIPAKVSSGLEDPVGTKGLLKWKGVMFEQNDNINGKTQFRPLENEQCDGKIDKNQQLFWHDCEIFMVELTRGWNSRLGFSLQSRDNATIISMVHPDSVAAKDGRLKQGDILIMVNDENVENVLTSEIIDLLRRIRGSIGITVARRKTQMVDT